MLGTKATPMAYQRNEGRLPEAAIIRDEDGKVTGHRRVIVKLRNGTIQGREPVSTVTPKGWDAKTTRWTLENHPYDIVEWELT